MWVRKRIDLAAQHPTLVAELAALWDARWPQKKK